MPLSARIRAAGDTHRRCHGGISLCGRRLPAYRFGDAEEAAEDVEEVGVGAEHVLDEEQQLRLGEHVVGVEIQAPTRPPRWEPSAGQDPKGLSGCRQQ